MSSTIHILLALYVTGVRITLGHTIAQFVEVLQYEPEGRGFVSRWCHRNFSLTQSFRPHYGPGVDSASNRNEYQKYFLGVGGGGKGGRCVGLTTLPPSCADCLEIWESEPPGTLRVCLGLYMNCFTFTYNLTRFYGRRLRYGEGE
jgi:hypothetical protein